VESKQEASYRTRDSLGPKLHAYTCFHLLVLFRSEAKKSVSVGIADKS
jgi:hypothetical protein